MTSHQFNYALLPVFIGFVVALTAAVKTNPYWHIANLDRDGRYVLEWEVNWTNRTVTFNVTVSTTGYIGFGLSRKGNKINADYVIGWVDATGSAYLMDMHGSSENELVKDESQDYILNNAWENKTHTSLEFSRPFETCDKFGQDYKMKENMLVLLWGIAENDNDEGSKTEHHFKYEGVYRIHLLDPEFTPRVFQDVRRARRVASSEEMGNDLKVWTVTTRQKVAAKETVYWCTFHKGPELQKRHHLIGFHFRWKNEIELNRTHHLNFFKCNPPVGHDPVQVFETFVQNNTGELCYFYARGEIGGLPLQYCRETKLIYAIGGRMFFLPDHAGIPFGDNPHEYYMLQTHYDNFDVRTDLEYTINIDMYYTEKLRKHDAGIVTVGRHIPGSPSILIPPNTKEHTIFGHCGNGCTSQMLPPEGINIISILQHTHLSGRSLRLRHFRNGTELPWIINDDNYDGNYQAMRMLREEVKVMPGDHLISHCVFDSTWTNGSSVLGGFGIRQEMCLQHVWYYNKMKEHVYCRSEVYQMEKYTKKHLGVLNYTWDDNIVDYVVTKPINLAGLSLQKVADKEIKWDDEERDNLQAAHMTLSQMVSCPSLSQMSKGNNGEGEDAFVVDYPTDAKEYEPAIVDQCS